MTREFSVYVNPFGATAVMTSSAHLSGTDRIAEAVQGLLDDWVVNIQGDEPLIESRVIDAAIEALEQAPRGRHGHGGARCGSEVSLRPESGQGQA